MSGPASDATWPSLLDAKKSQLIEHGCDTLGISSEATFRSNFENACRRFKEKKPTLLLSNLLATYAVIGAFASAVDKAAELVSPNDLAGLVWAASFAAVTSGFKARAKGSDIVSVLGGLNNHLPNLGANIPRFPHDSAVQNPLREIFDEYVETIMSIVACYNARPHHGGIETFQTRIEEAATKFEKSRAKHATALSEAEAAQEMERTKLAEASAKEHGLTNGTYENPNDSRAKFTFRRHLGRGSFGLVSEVQESSTRAIYARKLIGFREGSSTAAKIQKDVLNEVSIMQKLRHQHIASVLFYIKEREAFSIFMLPVGDCDLLFYLEERCVAKNYQQAHVKKLYPWFGCILDALAYAHRMKIKHCDIKPSNILINEGQPYLADFGVAKDFTYQEHSASGDYFVKGTPVYRAPETRPDNPRGRAADVFALGCVFAEMLTVAKGRSLHEFRQARQVPENESGVFAFRANLTGVSKWLKELDTDPLSEYVLDETLTMLTENPDDRPSAQDSVNSLKRERALFCPSH